MSAEGATFHRHAEIEGVAECQWSCSHRGFKRLSAVSRILVVGVYRVGVEVLKCRWLYLGIVGLPSVSSRLSCEGVQVLVGIFLHIFDS